MKTAEKFILLSIAVIFLLSGCGSENIENTLPNTTQAHTQENNSKDKSTTAKTQESNEVQSAQESFVLIKGGTFEMGSPGGEMMKHSTA